jgi:retinol-binding protein 3
MNSFKNGFMGIVLLLLTSFVCVFSQGDNTIAERDKSEIIETAIRLLQENYIYPERVKRIRNYLKDKLKSGGYAGLVKPEDFLQSLNNDLEEQGNDHHLNISFGPDRVKQIELDQINEKEGKKETLSADWLQRLKFENFRLQKVERLDGNIGYFNFMNFPPLSPAKESIVGAMNFLRFSSAIIIDLRENGGGYSETMSFLLGYFLKDSMQIGELRHRKGNRIEINYVPADAMIKKIPENIPLYILVSNNTSSAAEGFAYTLQQYNRAAIVGEQTKGEGNPGELFAINEFLYMMIPTIESLNPITGKGIDGIGVTPDIKISSNKAYIKALLEICRQLAKTISNKELIQLYEWQIPYLENELNPEPLTKTIINALVGDYDEGRKIVCENGNMYYININGQKVRLDYIGKGIFQNTERKWLRLVMPFTDKPISEFEWVWDDGGSEKVTRNVN